MSTFPVGITPRRTERFNRAPASQETSGGTIQHEAAKKRLAEAESGFGAAALVEVINRAQAEREAARAELASTRIAIMINKAEVYAMIDPLGDVGTALHGGKPERVPR